ncbi:MAG: restriction endonuclease subunit M, partial [Anaerolineaceae bacterium 4572_5.2]
MATGVSKTKWRGNKLKDVSERSISVSLAYEGKSSEEEILAAEPGQVVSLFQEGDNGKRLYYGDNLPILAALLQDPAIRGQVRLVYIDPPFATGSVFKSRSQQDAYSDL